MAHDVNFVGNRLRLVAFLGVVGQGMPHRPLRFKQRDQITDQQARNGRDQAFIECNNTLPMPRVSIGPTTPSSPVATAITVAQEGSYQKEQPVYTETFNDDLLSPISAQLCNDPGHDDVCTVDGARNRVQQPLSPSTSLKRYTITKAPSDTKTAGLMLLGPSRIQKRRLPVHQLALVRTPTYDGLARPVNTWKSTVPLNTVTGSTKKGQVPIAATHIEDVKRSDENFPLRHVRSSRQAQNVCSSALKPTRSTKQSRDLRNTPPALAPSAHQYFKAASDGFVGSELSIISVQMSARRKGPIHKKIKKGKPMRLLALRRGPAPLVMTAAVLSTTMAQDQAQSPVPLVSNGVSASREPQCQPRSTYSPISRHREATRRTSHSSHPRNLETIITSKLASISAPTRRSESSESRTTASSYSIENEDECDGDDHATVSVCDSAP
ncbi:hypothetical protein J1614_001310 [Plenodomus biglobosus]|nr:hypothetical protein J1614_001310 [Plenodomus biglobosus]